MSAHTQKFPLAERFLEVQGEGLYMGQRMAFVRTVGCSVGQTVCTACDTQFDRQRPELGGGSYTASELVAFTLPCHHMCISGGEPLDRDLRGLVLAADAAGITCHVETSGTVRPPWLDISTGAHRSGVHAVQDHDGEWVPAKMWVTVSPKPGYREDMVLQVADQLKVIIGGLGDGPGWPTEEDAVRWAALGKLVYVQPRNFTKHVDDAAMERVLEVIARHPELRLSVQLHKYLGVR